LGGAIGGGLKPIGDTSGGTLHGGLGPPLDLARPNTAGTGVGTLNGSFNPFAAGSFGSFGSNKGQKFQPATS